MHILQVLWLSTRVNMVLNWTSSTNIKLTAFSNEFLAKKIGKAFWRKKTAKFIHSFAPIRYKNGQVNSTNYLMRHSDRPTRYISHPTHQKSWWVKVWIRATSSRAAIAPSVSLPSLWFRVTVLARTREMSLKRPLMRRMVPFTNNHDQRMSKRGEQEAKHSS